MTLHAYIDTLIPMLTVEQARRIPEQDPDIVELLREWTEIQAAYQEVLSVMGDDERPNLSPVLNSSEVSLSFLGEATLDVTFE